MLKVALLAATCLVAATTAHAANADSGSTATPAVAAPCSPLQSLELDCAMRVIDTNGDGTISAAELASLGAAAPPVVDWPLHPPRSTVLDFKDAAAEPAYALPAGADGDPAHRLVPALFALGALVVLLRRRPA